MIRRRIFVTVLGKVQSVGFRRWTELEARALQCVGWVRNMPDGSVHALVEGDEPGVSELITRLHSGPAGAVISEVVVREAPPKPGEFTDFSILRSN
jgi:acylphosphatase